MTNKIHKPVLKILNVSDKFTSIDPADGLRQELLTTEQVKRLAHNLTLQEFNYKYPPILVPESYDDYIKRKFNGSPPPNFTPHTFRRKHHAYVVVGRQWSLSYLLDPKNKKRNILFQIFNNETEIKGIIDHEVVEANIMKYSEKVDLSEKPVTKNTKHRNDDIGKGIKCPLCGCSLVYRLLHQKPDRYGMYQIACYNLGNRRCNFLALVSMYEYKDLFKHDKLFTSDWIIALNEACPDCKTENGLYLRTLRLSEDIVLKYKICINSCRENATCTYSDPDRSHLVQCLNTDNK